MQGLVFDRGYFSKSNIKQLDEHGFKFVLALRDDYVFVKDLIKKYLDKIKDNTNLYIKCMDVFGISVKDDTLLDKPYYFHIYYDEIKGAYYKKRFLDNMNFFKSELLNLKGKVLRKNINLQKYKTWFYLDIDKDTNVLKT